MAIGKGNEMMVGQEEFLLERYELARERIKELEKELSCADQKDLPKEYREYFLAAAQYVNALLEGKREEVSQTAYVCNHGEMGELLAILLCELGQLQVFTEAECLYDIVIRLELFLEVYASFTCEWQENAKLPEYEGVRGILYWFAFDYSDVAAEQFVEGFSRSFGQSVYGKLTGMLYGFVPGAGKFQAEDQLVIRHLWDRAFISRKIEVLRTALEKKKDVSIKIQCEDSALFAELDGFSPGERKKLQEYCQQMKKVVAQPE